MAAEFLPNKKILGMRVRVFRGCGGCSLSDHDCHGTLTRTRVWLKHTGNERWDNGGQIVSVFDPNEMIEVEILHDASTIYCASAESTRYPGVSDYIDLGNFD